VTTHIGEHGRWSPAGLQAGRGRRPFASWLRFWSDIVAPNLAVSSDTYEAIHEEAYSSRTETLRKLLRMEHGDDVLALLADKLSNVIIEGDPARGVQVHAAASSALRTTAHLAVTGLPAGFVGTRAALCVRVTTSRRSSSDAPASRSAETAAGPDRRTAGQDPFSRPSDPARCPARARGRIPS
jgi:hypothetical protein